MNVANDVAFCRPCNQVWKLSGLASDLIPDASLDLSHPPEGTWHASTGLGTVVGASHRSIPTAVGTLFFALFWNGILSVFLVVNIASTLNHFGLQSPGWLPTPRFQGGTPWGMTLFLWFFLTPFIAVGALLIAGVASAIAGRTELLVRPSEGVVFSGIGSLGRRQRFNPALVKDVRLEERRWRDSDGDARRKSEVVLTLQDGKELRFGTALPPERRRFMAAAARQILLR